MLLLLKAFLWPGQTQLISSFPQPDIFPRNQIQSWYFRPNSRAICLAQTTPCLTSTGACHSLFLLLTDRALPGISIYTHIHACKPTYMLYECRAHMRLLYPLFFVFSCTLLSIRVSDRPAFLFTLSLSPSVLTCTLSLIWSYLGHDVYMQHEKPGYSSRYLQPNYHILFYLSCVLTFLESGL